MPIQLNNVTRFTIELIVLSIVIFLFLRFLRQTRGNRLVRGLIAALLLGSVLIWGLAARLDLDELEWIVKSVAGFGVVILAVVFQPELRRAISQLGARQRQRDNLSRLQSGTIEEIVAASIALAELRHGALIAIEGASPLDTWIDRGQRMGSPVQRLLLQSLFHPGAALHDGAVIVKGDRVAAAACFLPLSDDRLLGVSTGTRHRAALGLAEETDATVVVVSEETGHIVIGSSGRLSEPIAEGDLEQRLREALGDLRVAGEARRSWLERLGDFIRTFRRDASVIGLSVLIAAGLLWIAHSEIAIERQVLINVRGTVLSDAPGNSEIVVRLPGDGLQVLTPSRLTLDVSGTPSQVEAFLRECSGEIRFDETPSGARTVAARDVEWRGDTVGLELDWAEERGLWLEFLDISERTLTLTADNVSVDDELLDPFFEVDFELTTIDPTQVTIEGPSALLEQLDAAVGVRLAEIKLTARDQGATSHELDLAPELLEQGLALVAPTSVHVGLQIRPTQRTIGTEEREIALVSMDPTVQLDTGAWTLPQYSAIASFRIRTTGLLPANEDPTSPASKRISDQVREFVQNNLVVFVDLSELPPDGERLSLPVRSAWRRGWREGLWPALHPKREPSPWTELAVELVSEESVRLERRDGAGASGDKSSDDR